MHKDLRKRYNALEMEVKQDLRELIEKSKAKSKNVDTNCIKVNVFDYTELALINNDLTFLDSDGLQYSLYSECSLEDLIDIVNKYI